MRIKLLAAVTLLCTSCSQTPAPEPLGDIQAVTTLAEKALSVMQKMQGPSPEAEIQAATQEMIAVVQAMEKRRRGSFRPGARENRRIDILAAVKVGACTRNEAIMFLSAPHSNRYIRIGMAMDSTRCAFLAAQFLESVNYKDTADDIGFSLNMIFPIAIVLRAQAGLSTGPLMQRDREANEMLLAKLEPRCREWPIPEKHHVCRAYNGQKVSGKDRDRVSRDATRLTSREIARTVLPKLEKLARARPVAPSVTAGT